MLVVVVLGLGGLAIVGDGMQSRCEENRYC
jgi:hypothetical protein